MRLGPTLLGVSATASTARGTSSAVAETALAERARRRALPLRRPLRRAQPQPRRRLCAYRVAAPAPPTLSAVKVSVGDSVVASALLAARMAAPAPPANCAVAEILARTESVATRWAGFATLTTSAVAGLSATKDFADSLPCTRSGHSASVVAPGPSCPYAPKCIERLSNKSLERPRAPAIGVTECGQTALPAPF